MPRSHAVDAVSNCLFRGADAMLEWLRATPLKPRQYMRSPRIELAGIYIYPVKSLRGVRLAEVTLENGRLPGDRLWILGDGDGRVLHQRDYPQRARVAAAITPSGIAVSTAGLPELEIARPDAAHAPEDGLAHVRLWRRSAPVVHVSREADAWFTNALGLPCYLLGFVP